MKTRLKNVFSKLRQKLIYIRSKLPSKSKKILFVSLISIFVLLFIIIISISFIFVRHRQLCNYQNSASSGSLIADKNYCPNLLDPSEWGQIFANMFITDFDEKFLINPNYSLYSLDLNKSQDCTDELDPICWIKGNAPELAQTESGFTNIFLVGIDSEPGTYRQNLKNTDSMMLITIDNKTGGVLYTSFPRDMYLGYYRPNGLYVKYKLNAVYSIDGVEGLNGVIEQVTGQPIHYYAYINLDLFTQVIDKIGGVEIDLKEPFDDLYPCGETPAEVQCFGYYGRFHFDAGIQTLNSFEASVYTRSRLGSSDYDRAERQQNLLKAIVQNVLDDDAGLSDKFNTYISLYNIFNEQVETNAQLKDIGAAFALLDIIEKDGAQMVLTTGLNGYGNLLRGTGFTEGLGTNIGFVDESYNSFQNYRNSVLDHLDFYTDSPKIRIIYPENTDMSDIDGFINDNINYAQFTKEIITDLAPGIRVYDFSNGTKSGSIKSVLRQFENSLLFNADIDGIVQGEWMEDILIIYNP